MPHSRASLAASRFALVAMLLGATDLGRANDKPRPSCTLHGKVKFVTAFADYKIQFVTSFPDIRVKTVTAFPDKPGEWKVVDAFPDFTVQAVDAFPDMRVQVVDAFPGCPGGDSKERPSSPR